MAQQRYKVIERIDAGGMAEVFKANSTSMQGFQKLVAIKRILPNLTQNERFVRMFLDEAKVSLHLNHTNCVHVFDLGIADGTYFIVMEYVDGTNLKKLIEFLHRHDQPMTVQHAVFIAIEVCKGLTHAHEKRDQSGNPLDIVHRDISPPNVLLSSSGEVKITDFGLAKAKSQAEATDPGVVKGKFGYLSPEAAHGEEVDERTDIFAVGILLWEMLAGRRLFLGESDYDTLQLVRKAEIPSIRKQRNDVPPELEEVLMRTLAREVDARYQSAEDLGRSLAKFLFGHGRVVTSYDLSTLVTQFREQRPQRKKTAQDEAVGEAIQKQLDRLKSLEEIKDLDMYLAQHYDSLPDQGEVAADGGGGFEDPRMWADLGFGGDGPATKDAMKAMANAEAQAGSGSDSGDGTASWQEAGLGDIARSTSAYKAVQKPAPEAAGGDAKQSRPKRGGPPTLPGDIKGPPPNSSPAQQAQAQQAQAQQAQAQQAPAPARQPQNTAAPRQAADNPHAPERSPRQEHNTPVSPSKTNSSQSSSMAGIWVSLLVALVVVLLGATAFVLGLVP